MRPLRRLPSVPFVPASTVLAVMAGCLLHVAIAVADAPSVPPVRDLLRTAGSASFANQPAQTRGIVTWVDPTEKKEFLIHDGTGGLCITFNHGDWPEVGDVLEVDGTLTRGSFFPILAESTFRKAGSSEPPKPFHVMRSSMSDLLHGYLNNEPVYIEGWVRSAEMVTPTTLRVVLNASSYRITARISNVHDLNLEELVACKVGIQGIARPVKARGTLQRLVDAQLLAANSPPEVPHYISQLIDVEVWAADQKDLKIFGPKGVRPWDRTFTPLSDVFDHLPGQVVRGDWRRVRGQVILTKNGIAYLSDGHGGLGVKSADVSRVHPGEWVQAAGYPDLENGLPVLSDAMIKPAESEAGRIAPIEVDAAQLLDDSMHGTYVAVTGQLLDRMRAPPRPGESSSGRGALVLALQAPHLVFTAELEGAGVSELARKLEIGSTLRLQGICQVQTDASGNPESFRILVPGVEDVTALRPASFFTVKRLLTLLSITLAVLLVVLLIAFLIARRNIRLQAEIHEREAITAERNRLARDLHDTLEQGLTGIQLHLQGINAAKNGASDEIRKRLAAVRSLVQQCHIEARHSIWNLRSSESERFDLGEALERAARSLVEGTGIQVCLQQSRTGTEIPPLIEDNLFRIGQEALTNAVKHARPTQLQIKLAVTDDQIDLSVMNDGANDPPPLDSSGRFGLRGMQERADRIGGELTISSNQDTGCVVHVRVPIPVSPLPE
jgi:Signal transduction histidine kinase